MGRPLPLLLLRHADHPRCLVMPNMARTAEPVHTAVLRTQGGHAAAARPIRWDGVCAPRCPRGATLSEEHENAGGGKNWCALAWACHRPRMPMKGKQAHQLEYLEAAGHRVRSPAVSGSPAGWSSRMVAYQLAHLVVAGQKVS